VTLTPRQELAPVPYAMFAGTAHTLGTNGTLIGTPIFNNSSGAPFVVNSTTKVNNLNADLLDGLDSSAFWQLGGNAGTSPGVNYIGASDGAQVRLHATGGFLVDNATPSLSFGATRRQMVNLYNADFGFGVQDFTLYSRGTGFAWHNGGVHANNQNDPGPGGTNLMTLDSAGHLQVNAGVSVDIANANNGGYYPGLVFGPGSGESIASNRNPNDTTNRWGLNFFTGFQNRMTIRNDGAIGINTLQPEHTLDVNGNVAVRGTLLVDSKDQNDGTDIPGIIFGDYNSFEVISSQRGATGPNQYGLDFYTGAARRMSILNNGKVGIGTASPQQALQVAGPFALINGDRNQQACIGGGTSSAFIDVGSFNPAVSNVLFINKSSGAKMDLNARRLSLDSDLVVGRIQTGFLTVGGDYLTVIGGGDEQAYLGGDGIGNNVQMGSMNAGVMTVELFNTVNGLMDVSARDASVRTLTIRGGADLAEPFQMSDTSIPKGSLVIIDEEHPGQLKLADEAYDRRVAGIVSGANGIHPGITLHQEGTLAGGQNVALSGRVYALADASNGAIKPGDLLTSSQTSGHVMKVTDHARAQGAIVGKAMGALKEGQGMVLVLVTLQ
jgi:hypothetical protein